MLREAARMITAIDMEQVNLADIAVEQETELKILGNVRLLYQGPC